MWNGRDGRDPSRPFRIGFLLYIQHLGVLPCAGLYSLLDS